MAWLRGAGLWEILKSMSSPSSDVSKASLTQEAPKPEASSPRYSKSLFISLEGLQKLIKSILKWIKTVEQRKNLNTTKNITRDSAALQETMPTSRFKPVGWLSTACGESHPHGLPLPPIPVCCTPDMLDSHPDRETLLTTGFQLCCQVQPQVWRRQLLPGVTA